MYVYIYNYIVIYIYIYIFTHTETDIHIVLSYNDVIFSILCYLIFSYIVSYSVCIYVLAMLQTTACVCMDR